MCDDEINTLKIITNEEYMQVNDEYHDIRENFITKGKNNQSRATFMKKSRTFYPY